MPGFAFPLFTLKKNQISFDKRGILLLHRHMETQKVVQPYPGDTICLDAWQGFTALYVGGKVEGSTPPKHTQNVVGYLCLLVTILATVMA
jgi:hypothetical protein